MVLVDTSIWISHLRQGNEKLALLLERQEVVCHDFVIGELSLGHLTNRKILSLLRVLPTVPVVSQLELLYFIEHYSLGGAGIGFVDAHLLASARLAGVSLWAQDFRLNQTASKLGLSFLAQN